MPKSHKLHFELTPANNKRIEEFLHEYNMDPDRVTPKIKTADVVNRALDQWLSLHPLPALEGKAGEDG